MTRCRLGPGPRQSDVQASLLQFFQSPVSAPNELRPSASLSKPPVQVRVTQDLEVRHLGEEIEVRLSLAGVEHDVTADGMADGIGHDFEHIRSAQNITVQPAAAAPNVPRVFMGMQYERYGTDSTGMESSTVALVAPGLIAMAVRCFRNLRRAAEREQERRVATARLLDICS